MPSPFPGMDPYLEGADWRSVHTQFSVEIARHLAPKLRPKYFVRTEKNYILATPGLDEALLLPARNRLPDVSVTRSDLMAAHSMGGAAIAEAPLHMDVVIPEAVPQVTVEIHDALERKLVTAIEVLSPTNKKKEGREEYLAKRARLLRSAAHLVEIDLLRKGERLPMAQPLPSTAYCVIVHRDEKRPLADVWPVTLRSSLPPIPIPLLRQDPDVELNLQQVLTAMYDAFAYDIELDYRRPPEVPLDSDDAAWAQQLLGDAGFEPKSSLRK